jgi:hypothetical protein
VAAPWRRDLLGGVVFGVMQSVLVVVEVVRRCCGKRALLSRCRGPMGARELEVSCPVLCSDGNGRKRTENPLTVSRPIFFHR